jgi:hypothetical protein
MPREEHINEAGTFECVVVSPEGAPGTWLGENNNEKRTPFIRIPLEVCEEGSYNGKKATWKGYLTEAAFDKTIARLAEVFGFSGDINALLKGQITLEGLRCSIETEITSDNGKQYCNVKWLNRPGGGHREARPMDSERASSLLAKLTARAKAVAKNTIDNLEVKPGQAPKPQARPAPPAAAVADGQAETPVLEGDDVPF